MTLDNATFKHLTEWCDRALIAPNAGRDAILDLLDKMGEEDAAYSIAQGWSNVASLCDAYGKREGSGLSCFEYDGE